MSAVSPAPLPCPEPDDARCAVRPAGTRGRGRPALSVAGPTPDSPAARRPAPLPATPRPGTADQAAVRVRLVPRSEPPAAPLPAVGPAHRRPPVLGSAEALARPRPLTGETEDAVGPAQPLPDPTRTCCAVALAAVEGLRGARPLAQLTRWVTPEVYEELALRARLVHDARLTPTTGRAGIRRVRVVRIGDEAAEAAVVVDDGPRVRAVAVRLEEHRGRWRATALEIG